MRAIAAVGSFHRSRNESSRRKPRRFLALAAHVRRHHELGPDSRASAPSIAQRDSGVARGRVEDHLLPGFSLPSAIPTSSIFFAGRSLTEPPGLKPSSLCEASAPPAGINPQSSARSLHGVLARRDRVSRSDRRPRHGTTRTARRTTMRRVVPAVNVRPPAIAGTIEMSSPSPLPWS